MDIETATEQLKLIADGKPIYVWPLRMIAETALSELTRLQSEVEALDNHLRALSKMLTGHLGGGSEWFTRIGENFYADPVAIGAELQRRKTDAQETKVALYRGRSSRGMRI